MTEDVALSKQLSLMLRHAPARYGLTLDAQGFAPLANVLEALRTHARWSSLAEDQVREVVRLSDKQRFEIEGELIRARYGHSVPGKMEYAAVKPPEILYHGTSPEALPSIRRDGLRSMGRQYVHLSADAEQARRVGARHVKHPTVLTIHARAAWEAGVTFYHPEERLYLADAVPPEFIG